MQSLSEIRELLAARGLHPKRRFGQNFLHDKNQLTRLVDAAAVAPGDVVLEIGPGTGTLTEALLEREATVIACEIDRDLAELIRERFHDRIQLIEGDCLESERRLAAAVVECLAGRSFTLVANLPYGVASPLMIALLMMPTCRGQFVTIQREVADRLLAEPGTKAYGSLTIIARTYGDVKRLAVVKPKSFWPAPKVTSAMISLRPRVHDVEDPPAFNRFVVQLFTKRRKQLASSLGRDHPLPPGVSGSWRPESLTPPQALALWRLAPSA